MSSFKDSWRAKMALAMGAGAVSLALLWTVGEIAVRYRERHRATVPGSMPFLFYRHARLRHALVRDTDYFGWIHIDGAGFRGSPVSSEVDGRVTRVMVVGGSTTFDTFVSGDDRTWPARLAYWMAELDPTNEVEVINAGVPGYTVLDNLIRLQTELHQYDPDIVILYQGHNDLVNTLSNQARAPGVPSRRPGEMPRVTPWGHWVSSHSLLYAKLMGRFKALRFSMQRPAEPGSDASADTDSKDTVTVATTRFERDVSSFVVVAQNLGIRVVLPEVVHVSGVDVGFEADPASRRVWERAIPFARAEDVLTGYLEFNAVLERMANRFGVTFVPTATFGLRGQSWYAEGDPVHFNDRGADRMGHKMAEALLALGVW